MKYKIIFCFFCLMAGVHSGYASADEWAEILKQNVAQLSNEWSKSEFLAVSKEGYLDSLEVSPEGNIAFFLCYDGMDLVSDSKTGNFKGNARICMSERPFETRVDLDRYFMNDPPWSSCCIHIDTDGNAWYNTNREGRLGGTSEGDYDHEVIMMNEQILPFNNYPKDDNPVNPFFCKEKDELWLDYPEADKSLGVIYNAAANGFSGTPVLAPLPLNSDDQEVHNAQPYLTLDCNTIYFSSTRSGEGQRIYRSQRLTENQWSEPEEVVRSLVPPWVVGEPTLTADGKTLCYVQVFEINGGYRMGAFCAQKKGASESEGWKIGDDDDDRLKRKRSPKGK